MLRLLLTNAGRVLTREMLIDRVWGSDYVGDTKTLDVHIKRLRSKIEDDPSAPSRIITIRGLGYKFERPNAPTRPEPPPVSVARRLRSAVVREDGGSRFRHLARTHAAMMAGEAPWSSPSLTRSSSTSISTAPNRLLGFLLVSFTRSSSSRR